MTLEEAKGLIVSILAPLSEKAPQTAMALRAALQRLEEQDTWATAQAQQLLDYIEREKRLRQRVEELERALDTEREHAGVLSRANALLADALERSK